MIPNRFSLAILVTMASLLAPVRPALAVKYTPVEYAHALDAALGNRKGAAAYNKAARFLQKALGDKKNKKNAKKFTAATVKALKGGTVKISLMGRATNTLTKALAAGYFRGIPMNLDDVKFTQAFSTLLHGVPLSQRTIATSQSIYNSLKTYGLRRGVPQDVVFAYYEPIGLANRLPPPVS
jgi:hypothetical protein